MQHRTPRRPRLRKKPNPLRKLTSWTAARRRTALTLALRGACYGTGTGAASLITYWIEHHHR